MNEIQEKLLAVQKELKAPKNQRNNFGGYNYRSCEDILEAVKPLLVKHGLLLRLGDEMVEIGGRVYVKATAKVEDGDDFIACWGWAREEEEKKGMDASQITGAASSYARKYALNGLFCIDDTKDSNFTNNGPKEEKKKAEPKEQKEAKTYKCSECGKEISVDVAQYSYNKYKKLLCRDCQKKA